jgi:hypothetical protein
MGGLVRSLDAYGTITDIIEDPAGRIAEVREAVGTSLERSTLAQYDAGGRQLVVTFFVDPFALAMAPAGRFLKSVSGRLGPKLIAGLERSLPKLVDGAQKVWDGVKGFLKGKKAVPETANAVCDDVAGGAAKKALPNRNL